MTTLVGWGRVQWGLMSVDFKEMPCSPSTSMGQLQVARPGTLLRGHQGGGQSCWVAGAAGGDREGEKGRGMDSDLCSANSSQVPDGQG